MYLVLNKLTRLVSPQFHVSFDDFFETVRYDSYGTEVSITWQHLASIIQVSTIELEPVNETMAIATSSEKGNPSEQDLMFFTEDQKQERKSIANSNYQTLHSEYVIVEPVPEPQDPNHA